MTVYNYNHTIEHNVEDIPVAEVIGVSPMRARSLYAETRSMEYR